MKIKGKISLVLLVVSIILFSTVGLVFYYFVKNNTIEHYYDHLESISQTKEIRIHDMINRKKEFVRLASSSYFIIKNLQNYIRDPRQEFKENLVLSMKSRKQLVPNLNDQYVLNLDGIVVSSTNPLKNNQDFSLMEGFLQAKNNKEYLDGFFMQESKLNLSLFSPIYSNKKMIGVMMIDMDASDVISLTNDYTGLGKTGETNIAIRKNGETVFITSVRFGDELPLSRILPASDSSNIMNLAFQDKKGFFLGARDYRNAEVTASTRYIPETGWGLVTKIDKAEAYESILEMRNKLIVISLYAIAITLVVAVLIGKYFAKPIEKLTACVNQMAEGNLSQRVMIESSDEIGVLAKSVNIMAERLEINLKELNYSNNSLNKFAYVISHDLKSPLHSIISISEIIKNEYYDQTNDEVLRLIEMQSRKAKLMEETIIAVLQLAQKGYKKINKEKINVNHLLKNVLEILAPPHNIKVNIPSYLPDVYYHKIPLMQVFQNLIGNAIKYNDKLKGEVTVEFSETKNKYIFCVRDNGPGIKQEYFNKIFTMFGSITDDKTVESSGIGLYIVKRIVEEEGGNIWIESDIGRGSKFYFTINKYLE